MYNYFNLDLPNNKIKSLNKILSLPDGYFKK